MMGALKLPIIDLTSEDKLSTVTSVRQACTEFGFFYVINHGVDKDMLGELFCQRKKFFSLPLEAKLKLERKEHRGYTPFYSEKLDPLSSLKDALPLWRDTMEAYYKKVLQAGERWLSLISLALDLDDNLFIEVGALKRPHPFLRLLHYPGVSVSSDEEIIGASAHSDYGMITLLSTDGVPGLQVCREKDSQPRVWEDVPHIDRALIVNIGDMLERWTNCRFSLFSPDQLVSTGQERYSAAFILDPNSDCVVECLESCCSESSPPKFAPIRSGDYLQQLSRPPTSEFTGLSS